MNSNIGMVGAGTIFLAGAVCGLIVGRGSCITDEMSTVNEVLEMRSEFEADCNARIEAVESLLQTSEEMYAQEKKNCDDYFLQKSLEGNPVASLRWRMTNKCPVECTCIEDAQKELDICIIQRGMCERRLKDIDRKEPREIDPSKKHYAALGECEKQLDTCTDVWHRDSLALSDCEKKLEQHIPTKCERTLRYVNALFDSHDRALWSMTVDLRRVVDVARKGKPVINEIQMIIDKSPMKSR
jgi:hypothetical protein